MKKGLFAILFLVILNILFFGRQINGQGVFFAADEIASDLTDFSYPYKEFYASHLKKGKIVTWNPYVGDGTPVLGEAQTGVFHPLNLLLFYFLPVALAFNLRIILSFILLSVSIYLYCRVMKFSHMAAILSAASLTFSGTMVGHLKHVPVLGAIELFPLMFLCAEKIAVSSKKLVFSLILAFVLAISIFAGHLTSTYVLVMTVTVYFLVRMASSVSKKEAFLPYFLYFGAVLFSLVLAAIQVLPVFEMISYSTRAVTTLEESLNPPFSFKYLLFFIKPDIFGDPSRGTWDMFRANYWENLGYIGVLPLVLAALALFVLFKKGFLKRNRQFWPIIAVLVISFVLMLGKATSVYGIFFDYLPGFSVTRISGRFILFVSFALCFFAGMGLDFLTKKFKLKLFFIGFLVILAVFDLFHFGRNYNNFISTTLFSEPASVRFLKKDEEIFRVRSFERGTAWQAAWKKAQGWRDNLDPYFAQWGYLSPDRNILYRIFAPSIIYGKAGHFSLLRPAELDEAASQEPYPEAGSGNAYGKLYGLLNVKYFITSQRIDELYGGEGSVFADEKGNSPIYIYENKRFLPRVFIVPAYKVKDKNEILSYMTTDEFEPLGEVVLEEEPKVGLDPGQGEGMVQITNYQDRKVEVEAKLAGSGFLVFTDTWYPGWYASVDGQEAKIYRADYNFRSVYLPKGDHKIVFFYEPTYLKVGKAISIGSIVFGLFLLILLVFLGRKNKRRGLSHLS